nr:MAG TPA: hypothetical protein [Caudoviricetes sp.]
MSQSYQAQVIFVLNLPPLSITLWLVPSHFSERW